MGKATHQLLYHRERYPVPTDQETEWAPVAKRRFSTNNFNFIASKCHNPSAASYTDLLNAFYILLTVHRVCNKQFTKQLRAIVFLHVAAIVSAATTSHRQAAQVAITDTSLSDILLYQHLVAASLTSCSLQTVVSCTV